MIEGEISMLKLTAPLSLSLYIHLPWCVKKCPYCDFNSHQMKQELPEALYVAALMQDLEENLAAIQDRQLVSIFFGGGTPSLFSAEAIKQILQGVHERLHYDANIEITLEANPGTLDESRFAGFRAAGINRVSLGIQSLQDEKLQALGRIHGREQALRAIETLPRVGFNNFNLDLMHGLPNQSIDDALQDLKDALAFNPPHLSWYQLTLEPNTLFHHRPPVLPNEETLWQIQEQGKALITQHAFQQYEVSAYAIPGHECAHNRNYWEFGDYLGIGAGAHSKMTHHDTQQIIRHSQVKNPKDYLDPAKSFTAHQNSVSEKEIVFEFMLNALRLIEGVPIHVFTKHTGLAVDVIQDKLMLAREKKLLIDDVTRLQATPLGQRFLNDLTAMFM